jgi:hypothetical protein
MITFEQYLEMQWVRNLAGAAKKALGWGKTPTMDPAAPDEPTSTPTTTPYGNITRTSPSYAGDIDYFQGRRGATVGAYGSDMGHEDQNSVHHFDKASMTPEQKQAFWGMKMKAAQAYVKKDIDSLVAQYGQSGDPLMARIAKVIGQRLQQYMMKMSATYRKGGEQTPGAVNTLTKSGWKTPMTSPLGESNDPQQIAAMFEKLKVDFANRLGQPSGGEAGSQASADKDIMKLYYGIRRQVAQFAKGLKIGGMPQQNTQPSV